MDKSIAGTITRQALTQAILRRNPDKGLICHSDRGSQYAAAESFFHTLKVECIRKKIFNTREEAKRIIFAWIETRYNRTRRHSTLDYLSPFEYEKRYKLSIKNVY